MAQTVYALCALTALACAWLLLRSYAVHRTRLLLWSGLCFVGLTLNNVLLVLDRVVFGDVDLSILRHATSLVAMLLLVYGLLLEDD